MMNFKDDIHTFEQNSKKNNKGSACNFSLRFFLVEKIKQIRMPLISHKAEIEVKKSMLLGVKMETGDQILIADLL